MKTIALVAILSAATPAAAQMNCQNVGGYNYCNGPGYRSDTSQLGNGYSIRERFQQPDGSYVNRRTYCQQTGDQMVCN